MVSPFSFIVKPLNGKRYDNVRKYGDKEFIISSSQEDHTVTNRFAVVHALPLDYSGEIRVGDTVVVHHNVFRIYYDMSGQERSSSSHYKGDVFLVDHDQLFLYKRGDSDWEAPFPYCFIEPVKKEQSLLHTSGIEQELVGTIAYIPENKLGLNQGDKISFQKDMEYEFRIDGRKLYRMKLHNICLRL